jgi:type IV secretion system protein TrbI
MLLSLPTAGPQFSEKTTVLDGNAICTRAIFGTSIALGVVSGAAQITQGGVGYNSTGSQQFVNGAAAGISQQATTVLDRFIQIPPTITIREGHRVKVYFTQDMLLPAYSNHTIPQSF